MRMRYKIENDRRQLHAFGNIGERESGLPWNELRTREGIDQEDGVPYLCRSAR